MPRRVCFGRMLSTKPPNKLVSSARSFFEAPDTPGRRTRVKRLPTFVIVTLAFPPKRMRTRSGPTGR